MENHSKNRLEKYLSIFTEVKSGEGIKALFLVFNIFLILTAYYIIKPVREALILAGGTGQFSGAVLKSIAATGQVFLLIMAIPLYSWIASRVSRRKLINSVTIFFTACLVIFYILAMSHVPLGIVFFLWVGIFNLMIPAQFWAFANDLYTPEAGKRIFVLIAFGASSGAVLGGIIADLFIDIIGVYQLLLLAGLILLSSLVLTNIVETWDRSGKIGRNRTSEKTVSTEEPLSKEGAFRLVFQKKYLLMIALLMMLLNWVNTNGEYILGQTIENVAKESVQKPEVLQEADNYAREQVKQAQNKQNDQNAGIQAGKEKLHHEYKQQYLQEYVEEYIGNFYAGFFTAVNILGLFLQLFIVSRILKYLGIRIAILVLPLISLFGYFTIAFIPILSIIRWVKIAENATDYSLQNTVRHALFLPTTREEKYKAKQAIDTFFWRAGDVLSTVIVTVGSTLLLFTVKHFAVINLILVCLWLLLAYLIGRENFRLTRSQDSSV
ncbi:MAG: MFS transporter [bacterium]|nr:MAG: MFS transporter [bacterium]